MNMKRKRIEELKDYYYDQLVNNTVPFWTKHSADREYGGYTTFLDRRGELLSTDKPMWVIGRFAWVLSRLYNALEKREEWLELAGHGVDFMMKYGFDKDGRMFYAVTRDGRPLRKRRYLFTETFGVIALAEYARASGDQKLLARAIDLMELVRDLYNTPDSLEPKVNPQARATRGHSMAMIQINTYQVLRAADPEGSYDGLIDAAIEEVFRYFVKPEKKVLLETVGPGGEYLADIPEGRCVNPGHAIETAWFIMEEGRRRNDSGLVEKALPLLDWHLDLGWDMKLWWPHNEATYATLLAYHLTGENKYLNWFEKLHKWSTKHFPDREFGEWLGYLHRDGSLALDCKGNYFKGPFHVPRQQLYCHLLLKEMLGGSV
jgi:N-acylglucosamine 2-epimerase